MTRTAHCRAAAVAVLALPILAQPAFADPIADFYKDKTVSIVVGHETGTGFDIYSRVLARHLGRHIPSNPSIVVQNMTGASGLVAGNWLAAVAPKDGTAIATFVHTVAFEPLMGNAAAKLDPQKLAWIGNMEDSVGTCGVSRASGIARFDDLLQKEAAFGATGATGPLGRYALALKNLVGAKMKVVHGYKGSASVKVAVQRGEVQGVCGLPMSTLKSFWRDDLESGAFKVIIQLSGRAHPELKDVPRVDAYAKTDDDRAVFGLIFGSQALGRVYAAPPGIPAERRNVLRAAFTATMKDAQFLAEAQKTQIDISPMTGEEVEAAIARYAQVSPAVMARAKDAYRRD